MKEKRLRSRLRRRTRRRDRQIEEFQGTQERGHAKAAKQEAKAVRYLKKLLRIEHRRTRKHPLVMFDSVDLTQLPREAKAVAGYVGGNWPTFIRLKVLFRLAKKVSIAVASRYDADCLDIERGDATPGDAPAWVRRQQARGEKQPIVYGSVSEMDNILHILAASGISRREVRVWTAHDTDHAHICGPHTCGELHSAEADATQWTDTSRGKNLDESRLTPTFFK